MIIKNIPYIVLGFLFGYINGYYSKYNATLIKLSCIFLIVSILFLLINRKDYLVKLITTASIFFIMSFIIGSIRTHIEKSEFEIKNIATKERVVITNVNTKDSTKILQVKFLETSQSDLKDKKAVLYIFSIDKFYPDQVLEVEGKFSNQIMILPKKSELTNVVKSFDLAEYWRSKGKDYVSMYPKIKKIEEVDGSHSLRYYSYIFRERFHMKLNQIMDNENAGILSAMLWGDESAISKDLYNKYTQAGVSHILVLSGYNLAILTGFILLSFKGYSVKSKVIFSLVLIGLFLLLANSDVTLWRAAVMSLYSLAAMYFMKPSDSKIALWLAVLVFTLLSPIAILKDVSLQMSILATMSIIYFYPIIKDNFSKNKDKNYTKLIREAIILTISANILLLPFLIYTFGYIKISGIFVSVILCFIVPIIMFLGFLGGFISFLSIFLGKVIIFIADLLISAMYFIVNLFYGNEPIYKSGLSFFGLTIVYLIMFIFYKYVEYFNYSLKNQKHE